MVAKGEKMKTRGILPIVLWMCCTAAYAKTCDVTVHANDQMQFDQQAIHIAPNCSEVTLQLIHTGHLPASVMGHNWVLTRSADYMAVAEAGDKAGVSDGYVPLHDPRVIAHTALIGGGQQTRVTFSTKALVPGEQYTYFCSFPGHWSVMKGTLTFGSPKKAS